MHAAVLAALLEALLVVLAATLVGMGAMPLAMGAQPTFARLLYLIAGIGLIGNLAWRGAKIAQRDVAAATVPGIAGGRALAYLEVYGHRLLIASAVLAYRVFRAS